MARHRFWSSHREYELRSFGESFAIAPGLLRLERHEAQLALEHLRREERSDVRRLASIHRLLLPRAPSASRLEDPVAFWHREWPELERAVATGLVDVFARPAPSRAAVRRVVPPAVEPAAPLAPVDTSNDTEWIVIELVDDEDRPLPGQRYRVRTPDGRVVHGTLDRNGRARIEGIPGGECDVTFPELDGREWKAA